jgi:hypothetical protein
LDIHYSKEIDTTSEMLELIHGYFHISKLQPTIDSAMTAERFTRHQMKLKPVKPNQLVVAEGSGSG